MTRSVRSLVPAFLLLTASLVAASPVRVTHLEADLAVNPLGVDDPRPRLGWRLASEARAQRQTAWQVLVASSPEKLAAGEGDLWDSGRVESDVATFHRYAGRPLVSSQTVHWKVRVWNGTGEPSDWSAPGTWTMGLLAELDWKGTWIGAAETSPTLLLRREIAVRPGLRRALVHVTGLGSYEFFLNGEKVGRNLLGPGWTDFAETVLYDTFDVTEQVRAGTNALGLALADGMFHVRRPEGRFAKFVGSFGAKRARLHLELEYADGTHETIGTDGSWRTHAGPHTFAGIYGGEDYDARLLPAGWNRPGFDASAWPAAVSIDGPGGVLRGHSRGSEPVVAIETRPPVAVRDFGPAARLYDFGQNTSFIPRLRFTGPAGSTVRLTPGEDVLEDGTINRGTMGGADRGSAWWQYTKATDGVEVWFPQFYYLGSRYLHVEFLPAQAGGPLPDLAAAEMVIVHADAEPAGTFESSDETLNRIHQLVRWAQRSNMVSILTDCPHREKLGWLEQTHLNGPSLRYEWDHDRLAAKTVYDMADAQTEEGLIPNIAPEYTVFRGAFRAAAEWGAAFIAIPWQQYVFTGDDTLLREFYPQMTRYFAYLEGRAAGGLLTEGLGDWFDHTLGRPGRANLTPARVTATAFLFQNALTLARAAEVLGRTEEAQTYTSKAKAIRAVYNRELFRPASPEIYGTGTQTSLAIPLAMGLVEEADRPLVTAALVEKVTSLNHIQSGAAGIRFLLRSLADAGRSDLVFSLATNPEMPGYAYQLAQGNTSLAETWVAQRGASQNHFFMGQIVEWMYADLAGIVPDERAPGFAHVRLRPRPIESLDWVKARHTTVRGPVAVSWRRAGGRFHYEVEIPANATATLELPARDDAIREGGRPVAEAEGVRRIGRAGDRVVLQLGSGRYRFESTW